MIRKGGLSQFFQSPTNCVSHKILFCGVSESWCPRRMFAVTLLFVLYRLTQAIISSEISEYYVFLEVY